MIQLDLFKWADNRPTARIYDWNVTFAERVMSRIHEYDDMWPKPHYDNKVFFIGKAEVRRVCR